jgi:folate-binding protein YgfZ
MTSILYFHSIKAQLEPLLNNPYNNFILNNMSFIAIKTPNSKLLDRLITQKIQLQPKLSCICNHQGKVLSRFWVKSDDNYSYLYIDNMQLDALISLIKKYDIHGEIDLTNQYSICPSMIELSPDKNIHQQLIENCIPTITDQIYGKYTPHVLNLSQKAVAFDKGCFIGHEPIARTEFKGKIKKQLSYLKSKTFNEHALEHYFDGQEYHMLILRSLRS